MIALLAVHLDRSHDIHGTDIPGCLVIEGCTVLRSDQGPLPPPTLPEWRSVVFIGSISSQGIPGQIAYASTKAGLEGASLQKRRSTMSRRPAITEKRPSTTPAVAMKRPDITLMLRMATTCIRSQSCTSIKTYEKSSSESRRKQKRRSGIGA
jgi:NAD(P)-dependent dehydrogenase (short-subunit alcohol dehydrogenase family)